MIAVIVAGMLTLRGVEAFAQPPSVAAPAASTEPQPALPAAGPAAPSPAVAGADDSASPSPAPTSRPAKLIQDRRVKRWIKAFSWTTILLLIFIFAAAAIVVFSRRFKDYLLRPKDKPTEYVDAWQMYRLPPEEKGEGDGPTNGDDDE